MICLLLLGQNQLESTYVPHWPVVTLNWSWTHPGLCPGNKTILRALGTSRRGWNKAQFLSHHRGLARQEQVGAQSLHVQDLYYTSGFLQVSLSVTLHHTPGDRGGYEATASIHLLVPESLPQ